MSDKLPDVPEEFRDHEITRGTLVEWDAIGKMFIGYIRALREQKGTNSRTGEPTTYFTVDASTKEGEDVFFSAGKILAQQLTGVKPTQLVCIQYVGTVPTSSGQKAKDFKVFVKPGF